VRPRAIRALEVAVFDQGQGRILGAAYVFFIADLVDAFHVFSSPNPMMKAAPCLAGATGWAHHGTAPPIAGAAFD
jgi:hypothetical protein